MIKFQVESLQEGLKIYIGGHFTPANRLDVYGSMGIGTSYSGIFVAPTDGLIVQGNVGIGTPSPDGRLDVESGGIYLSTIATPSSSPNPGKIVMWASGSSELIMKDSSGTVTILGSGDFDNGGEAGGMNRTLGNTDNYSLGFLTNNSTRVFVQNDGKVGIGTNAPSNPLHVKWDENNVGLLLENGATANIILRCIRNASADEIVCQGYSSGAVKFQFHSNGDSYFNGGRLGVGTSSPSEPLEVSGGVKATSFTATATGTSIYSITSSSGIRILNGNFSMGPNAQLIWPGGEISTSPFSARAIPVTNLAVASGTSSQILNSNFGTVVTGSSVTLSLFGNKTLIFEYNITPTASNDSICRVDIIRGDSAARVCNTSGGCGNRDVEPNVPDYVGAPISGRVWDRGYSAGDVTFSLVMQAGGSNGCALSSSNPWYFTVEEK